MEQVKAYLGRVGENRRSSKDMNKMTDAKGGQDATTLSCLNFNCPKWAFLLSKFGTPMS